jgi:predicted MFS family arabinose efflux permease
VTTGDQITGVRGGVVMLTALLTSAMGAGTFAILSLGVLASFIIDDLGITRGQLGLIIGADTIFAGVAAPHLGALVDRLGGKRALVMVFCFAAAGWVTYAVAPFYGLLFAGALFSGTADSTCNPATNRLIAEIIPVGRRGVVTGIKQSGVQAGAFLGGLVLPSMAVAFGWRWTLAAVAVLPVIAALAVGWLVRMPPVREAEHRRARRTPLPGAIRWLASYGFLFGVAGSASLLVPLFVEESLGFDARVGGLVAATIGLTGVVGRIWWARLSERRIHYVAVLGVLTPLAVLSGAAFYLAGSFTWLMWIGALLMGFSTVSWNGVGMLAAMNEAGAAASGRASGAVVFGFLLGLGIGPPVYGAVVDWTGSYAPMWVLSIGASVATGLLVLAWRRWSAGKPARVRP